MYKNLNAGLIGISGRQSELIELALTYGFRGLDIDLMDVVKRTQRSSFDAAARFLLSSKLTMSSFDAAVDLDDDEDTFAKRLAALPETAEIAKRIGARVAIVRIPPATDRLPYHEFFNVIRKRIDEIAGVLGKEDVNVALSFTPIPSHAAGKQFKFVSDVEGFLALTRACNASNVGMVFDSWNWHVGGRTADQLAELPVAKVFALRIADMAEDANLKEVTTKQRLLPGSTGLIDNVRIVKHFADAGYSGALTAMGHPLNTAGVTRDAVVGWAQDALDRIMEEAGLSPQTRKPEMFAESSFSGSSPA